MIKKHFSLLTILSISLSLKAFDNSLQDNLLQSHNQLKEIDLSIERLAQGIASKSVKVESENKIREYLKTFRNFISDTSNEKFFKIDTQSSVKLLKINEILLAHLNTYIQNGLIDSKAFEKEKIINWIDKQDLTSTNKEALFEKNKLELEFLNKSFQNIGLSKLNILAKKIDKLAKDHKIKTLAKRSWPYLGVGLYFYLKEKLPGLTKKLPKTNSSVDPKKQPDSFANLNKFAYPFIKFQGITEPFITFGVGAIVGPKIKEDFEDLKNWSSKWISNGISYLKGESIKSDTKTKKSKLTFDDIIGFNFIKEKFEPLIDFYKKKDLYNFIGTPINRGYILSGSLETSNNIARALAGQITKEVKEKKPDYICGVYEIHSSELIEKELKNIVSEIEKEAPCILLIKELEWLSIHADAMPDLWSGITGIINKTLNDPKNQITIITTTQNHDYINSCISLSNLGELINIEQPSTNERMVFLTKELKKRCINIESLDLKLIVQETENCTYQDLSKIISTAFASAQYQNQTINQKHLEHSVNQVVHKIIFDRDKINSSDKKFLSANISGQLIAFNILRPKIKLLKATIFPVLSDNDIRHGQIFISDENSYEFETKKSQNFNYKKSKLKKLKTIIAHDIIENNAKIQLAGIQAQKILCKNFSYNLSSYSRNYALEMAKTIVLQGLDEDSLSSKIMDEKLGKALELVVKWENQVSELLEKNKDKLKNITKILEEKMIIKSDLIEKIL